MAKADTHEWTYASIGGVTRVTINSGDDIAHLNELDQKLWTVLSCPVSGLEFDETTLRMMDSDGDGKIRVNEVVAGAQWLTNILKDNDKLLDGNDCIAIDDIDSTTADGEALASALERLKNKYFTGQDTISLSDIATAKASLAEKIGARESAEGNASDSRPYGDNTNAAIAAVAALRDKTADFFMRCKLIAFDEECTSAVDVSVEKIQSISDGNMASNSDAIASYPLARPNKEGLLHLNEGINPAWQSQLEKAKELTINTDYPGATSINEQQWLAIVDKLDAYTAAVASDKTTKVELLDKETAEEEADITLADKFLHMYRDFYTLLKNYIFFADFYSRDKNKLAVFQCGQLYIDQRCCDLCIKVTDMSKHADMAGLSGMFLIYCHCVSKVKGTEMDIVAALTNGDIDDLRVGKNAVFYDRSGQDWDAVVTKIVDNPVSVRQAFWAPYKKLWKFITDKINKNAAEKESKQMDDLTAKADTATDKIAAKPADGAVEPVAAAEKKTPFDIAKFAGIFAAIGLALGAIGAALAGLGAFVFAKWYNIILLVAAVVVIVSGPSMFIAWSKLRKRNLGPVLNANGWAINAQVRINTAFGATLTSMAKYPIVTMPDPYADKKTPAWKKWLITIIVLAGVFCALYFTNTLKHVGLPFKEEPAAIDSTAAAPASETATAAEAENTETPQAE